ncbi:MAG: zinc-ribbon domain-containing protein [Clostridia bacterium]|nr:zinc-ribbon domain-containing protein [Clostridia bacterium]MBQ5597972.1 zinc-ribbon domain-containing protein [Clostridia bacterium]
MFCQSCGAKLNDGEEYCYQCGKKQAHAEEFVKSGEKKPIFTKETKKMIIETCVYTAILITVTFAIFAVIKALS